MGPAAVVGRLDANGEPGPLGESDQRQQPCVRDRIRLVEERKDMDGGRGRPNRGRALSPCVPEASRTPMIAGHKALPRLRKGCPQASSQWIRAQPLAVLDRWRFERPMIDDEGEERDT